VTVRLHKCSSPGWEKDFETMAAAIDELRTHICSDCLSGSPGFLDDVVDVGLDGRVFECCDESVLLSTPCGCEYEIEEIAP
jgi:hypothetical protein